MNESFFARRSLLIVCVLVFTLPFIFAGTRRTLNSKSNDIKDWLPQAFDETAEHSWFQAHFPHEQFVLISWEGCFLHDQRLELLAKKLVPDQLDGPQDHSAAAEELSGESADEPKKKRRFNSVLTGTRLVEEMMAQYEGTSYALSEEEVLDRLEGSLIHRDPKTGECNTCLVVTLSEATKGRELRPTLAEIRRIAAEECHISPEEIRLGGPPVDNVAIDIEGERTLFRLAGLSAIVGLGISWLCFRSIRLTAIVFWVAILSAGVGLSLVYFTGGTCDAILLTMPSLVYVLALSGAIHMINYYHDGIREGGLDGAPDRALSHAWFPCTMAALTTALGLGSLMISHVIPISKFGLYSALGVLATLVLVFLYLPALLHFFPSREFAAKNAGRGALEPEDTVFLKIWRVIGGFVIRNNVMVSLGCVAIMVVFAFGLFRVEASVKLMKLFSSEAEIIHHYAWLEKHLGPLVPMEVVLTVDNEQCELSFVDRMRIAQEIEAAIETRLSKDVGGALSAATFAPDISPRKGGTLMSRVAYEGGLTHQLEKSRDEFHEYLTVDVDRLKATDPSVAHLRIAEPTAGLLRGQGLKNLAAIEQFGDLATIEGIGPEDATRVAEAIDTWRSVSNPTLEQLGIVGPVAEILKSKRIRTLRAIESRGYLGAIKGIGPEGDTQVADAVKAWEMAHGTELWRISARVWALTDVDYADFMEELQPVVEEVILANQSKGAKGIDARYTGLVPLVYKTQHELFRGLVNSLTSAFGLIAIVMIVVLKSPSAGLLSMIPNVFPVVVIFGAMGWLGILVDIGSMMTASVALGVAVDDTMHYLTWFRHGLDRGLDRKGAAMAAYERCATAMSQTTLVGGLGLAAFAFSTFTPTQRFGTLMLVLLFTALIGDLIFLPALLTGPLGYFFGRRRKKSRTSDASQDLPDTAQGLPEDDDPAMVSMEDKPPTLHSRGDFPQRSHKAS
jgi:predicted RND superfamily exporter protein